MKSSGKIKQFNLSEWLPTEPDFELIGIYSHLKDYRLCWLINQEMSIELVRTDDFQEDKKDERIPSYAQFLWADEVNHREVYLISNKPVIKITDRHNGMLFETEHVELLIPERPKVDYFFQLYGQFEIDEIKEMDTILNTTVGIGLAEHIDTSALKSFVNLMH